MEPEDIDGMLYTQNYANGPGHKPEDTNHYMEQYRIYLHVFNATSDRSHKSNEFFLGLNAAIIGILGYAEAKSLPHPNIIFTMIPIVGISISYSWYKIIRSYSQINRAKFKVLHKMEEKLPIALFKTEWSLLGEGKDKSKYYRLSKIEKNIPITFILLYIIILIAIIPWTSLLGFLGL